MYLVQNLKYLREQRGLSQREFSMVLGLSYAAIGNWETGIRKPDIEMIVKIAEYFGVTLDELVLKELKPHAPSYVENLKFLRQNQGLKQKEMAELLKISKASYCKYENGDVDISVGNLLILADFFDVTLDQLVKQDLKEGD